ncbi:MAG: mycothiol synthase [Marmoricola sp.]
MSEPTTGHHIVEVAAEDFEATNGTGTGPSAEVRRIAEACDVADRVITLNEQTCLQLKYRGLRDARLWLAGSPAQGFALLHNGSLDLAVHPEARGRGIGGALAEAALVDTGHIEAWSHADDPAAARLAERFGVPRERELLIMTRPTSEPLPPAATPEGTTVTTFAADDTEALLAVNAAAFTHHPEQGHMTSEDFLERTSESWFDPRGLFLVKDADGELLGFHWTKVHRDEEPPYGEVYVVAVNPRAAGRGIGRVLTDVGLRHLADAGVERVILYVDGDNEPAVALYRGFGFTDLRTEVQYRGTVGDPSTLNR